MKKYFFSLALFFLSVSAYEDPGFSLFFSEVNQSYTVPMYAVDSYFASASLPPLKPESSVNLTDQKNGPLLCLQEIYEDKDEDPIEHHLSDHMSSSPKKTKKKYASRLTRPNPSDFEDQEDYEKAYDKYLKHRKKNNEHVRFSRMKTALFKGSQPRKDAFKSEEEYTQVVTLYKKYHEELSEIFEKYHSRKPSKESLPYTIVD